MAGSVSYTHLAKARKEKLPLVDENYNLKGLITIKDIEKDVYKRQEEPLT